MSEIELPVEVVGLDYACDECNEPMRGTGVVYASWPPKYPSKCANGHDAALDRSYPTYEVRLPGVRPVWMPTEPPSVGPTKEEK